MEIKRIEKIMKTKRVLSIVLCLVLAVCTAGCGDKKESDVPQPDMAMKTVSQNSKEDYVTFEFQLPEDWISGSTNQFSAVACPQSVAEKEFDTMEQLPYVVNIVNYSIQTDSEMEQVYRDLFKGNPETYRNHINHPPPTIDNDSENSFLGYLNALAPEKNESAQPSYGDNYISDFQYKLYQGKNGKIAEVQYKFQFEGKEYHTIECYREDIPYRVSGNFDDQVDLSSGELALWVADSLQTKEHFTLKDGNIEKKG